MHRDGAATFNGWPIVVGFVDFVRVPRKNRKSSDSLQQMKLVLDFLWICVWQGQKQNSTIKTKEDTAVQLSRSARVAYLAWLFCYTCMLPDCSWTLCTVLYASWIV